MGPIPFAFSVHNFVNSVGAYAGFAAIVGLAILILLYFAQARETATLREHAYEAAQRIQQLEARIAQLSRRGAGEPARQPTVAPAPAAITASRGVPAAAPLAATAAAATAAAVATRRTASPAPALAGAPAGVGAPALSAATRLIPVVGPEHGELEPGTDSATAVVPRPATVAAATAAGGAMAAGANGRSNDAERPVPVGAGPVQAPPRRASGPSGNGAAQRPLLPPRNEPPRGPSTLRKVLAVVVVLLALAAVVVALLLLTSSSGSTKSSGSTSSASSNAPKHNKTTVKVATINPATVTVSVLNGTATAGLAHRVSVELTGVGFKQGAVATAADQTRTATIVGYQPGHRTQALAVAKSLKLGPAVVQPVDQSTLAVACPPPTPCTSTVFVTVGSDLQNTP